MSASTGSCAYVFDPDDPDTWGGNDGGECYVAEEALNDQGVWTCPHDSERGEDLCIFHLPTEKKTDEEVMGAMLNAIEAAAGLEDEVSRQRQSQFIGGRFGTIRIVDSISSPYELNLKHSTVDTLDMCPGEFAGPTVIDLDIALAGSECDVLLLGSALAGGAEFRGEFDCRGIVSQRFRSAHEEFYGPLDFRNAQFSGSASLGRLFKDKIDFRDAQIDGSLSIEKAHETATVGDTVDLRNASIGGGISAKGGVEIEGDLRFDRASLGGSISFAGLSVAGTASFSDAQIFGSADFRNASFGEATFADAVFEADWNFADVDFGHSLDMSRTSIEGEAVFDRARVEGDTEPEALV